MKASFPIVTGVALCLAALPTLAAAAEVPQGALAHLLGKAAPAANRFAAVPSENRFAAVKGGLASGSAGMCNTQLSQPDNGRRLWAIYMIGSDLESKWNSATTNFNQLIKAWRAFPGKDNIDIVVAFGGSKKAGWQGVKYATIAQLEADALDGVFGNGSDYLYQAPDANMGSQATFESFLRYVNGQYPQAGRKFLNFWNHGSSYQSTPGVGPDEITRTVLDLVKINNGLANTASCYHLIGFDACLMASMETATAVKDFAQYLVASEELEPGHGWNYGHVLAALSGAPSSADAGKAMVDSFVDSASHPYRDSGKTLSVLELNKLDGALAALAAVTPGIEAALAKLDTSQSVIQSFNGAQRYADTPPLDPETTPPQVSIDLKDFLQLVRNRSNDAALRQRIDTALAALEALVTYSRDDGTRPYSGGVSIAPLDMLEKDADNQTSAGLLDGPWRQLIATFQRLRRSIAAAPQASAVEIGATARNLGLLNLRDGTREETLNRELADHPGLAARFASSYMGSVRSAYGYKDQDGALVVMGELNAFPSASGSYYAPQWDGRALTLVSAAESVPVPLFINPISHNNGNGYSAIVAMEDGEGSSILGLLSVEPGETPSITPLYSNPDGGYTRGRESYRIVPGAILTFFTLKVSGSKVDAVPVARHTWQATPRLELVPSRNADYYYTLVGYDIADNPGYAPLVPLSSADRVFNWAEVSHPQLALFGDSFVANGYYARCNPDRSLCVGDKGGALWLYDKGAFSGLGNTADWLNRARAAGF